MVSNHLLVVKGIVEAIKHGSVTSDFKVVRLRVSEVCSPGVTEVRAGRVITCVGKKWPKELSEEGVAVKIRGSWEQTRYGMQFSVEEVLPLYKNSREGLIRFLSSKMFEGVGEKTAEKIVGHFGDQALDVLENAPEKLKEVAELSEKKAEALIDSWNKVRSTVGIIPELCSLGLSVSCAKKVVRYLGNGAIFEVKRDPYVLTKLPGIGFLRADEIAQKRGISSEDPQRIRAGILYTLNEAVWNEGHCYLPSEGLIDRAQKMLKVDGGVIIKELEKLDGQVIFCKERVYLKELYEIENYVANRFIEIKRNKDKTTNWNREIEEIGWLSEEQKRVVGKVLGEGIACLSGLPGTGKTTCIKAILEILEKKGLSYKLAAPTGKAAQRITEQTGREAQTIHRLLGASSKGRLLYNSQNPLNIDYLIIDEVSMVDLFLMKALLQAVDGKTRVILVGDHHQLPSVGPGQVLRDIISKGLFIAGILTEIHRQAAHSGIVGAAHSIQRGEKYTIVTEDFRFIPTGGADIAKKRVIEEIEKNPDAQVLVPMKRGMIGSYELNKDIRKILGFKTDFFEKGDRVIQKRNNYEKWVFNGEVGKVVDVDVSQKAVVVEFDERQVLYESDELDEIDFAYALTVHKAQGSEYQCVVIPLVIQHYIMLFRNLIYTAVTRGKKMVTLIGENKAYSIGVKNDKPVIRYSGLGERC